MANERTGWIGVDLDPTIAYYDGWKGPTHIGMPIMPMVDRVKGWLAAGRTVKIFTARVSCPDRGELEAVVKAIEAWCLEHIGQTLEVTCVKDYDTIAIYDDRARQVEVNTGRVMNEKDSLR